VRAEQAERGRARPRGDVRDGGDADEAGEQAVREVERVEFPGAIVGDCARADAAEHHSERGVEGDSSDGREVGEGDVAVLEREHVDGRADVEPVPAEAEDERAEDGESDGVTGHHVRTAVVVVATLPGADEVRRDDGGRAAERVDHRAAGEVVESHAGEPATGPDEAVRNRVDDARDDGCVDDVHPWPGAAGDRAGDDVRGGDGEHAAEQPRHPRVRVGGRVDVRERPGEVEAAAPGEFPDERGDRRADSEVRGEPDDERDERLRELVGDVLRAHLSGLKHREPGLHEEDEERRDE